MEIKMTSTTTDLTIPSDNSSFSIGFNKEYAKLPSFGNKTFEENVAKIDSIFVKTNELQKIWNHSMSQFMWKSLNLTTQSEYRNIRQVAAELASKKSALSSAKWNYLKGEIKLLELEDKLKELESDPNQNKIKILKLQTKIMRIRENLTESLTYIEGAMKDVMVIDEVYDKFKEKYQNFSEEEFEKEEAKSNLIRALSQSLRDVRERGSITKGEQEYLENMGLNPSKVLIDLKSYLENVESKETTDYGCFIEQFS